MKLAKLKRSRLSTIMIRNDDIYYMLTYIVNCRKLRQGLIIAIKIM